VKEAGNSGYNHIIKSTTLFGGVQGMTILIGLVRNKAMALLLGTVGMGFNALMMSVQTFAAQCTNLGLSFGAIPKLSEVYEQEQHEQLDYYVQVIRLWSLIAAVLGLVFCVVASGLVDNLTFTWGDHTLHYAMLGVSVAMLAISGGETAVLKATRRMGSLARVQIYGAVGAVVTSVPLYYYMGQSGVVPSIVLIAAVNMLLTLWHSYRCCPLKLVFSRHHLHDGFGMIKLGLAFVLAAAFGSGSEMAIRAFLNVDGGMDNVGFYNAAYMITITYASMVFSAMETDYFPRLSAVNKDVKATNETVNKQTEVSLLFLAPMLVALLTLLPVLIPILFSRDFMPIVAMAQVAVLAMYFKVLTMPVAYITLARSYSLSFLLLESVYFVALVTAIVLGYRWWGIWGTGVAIVVAHVVEFLTVYAYAYWQYSYRSTWRVARYALVQMAIGGLAYAVSLHMDGWAYWITEAALTLVSTAYSLYVLHQKTHLWEALMRKFSKIA
jgi:O-antigen/teichoic acid export membrane protein